MEWHDLRNPNDPRLDQLAERYHIHPLHIEDCRHRNQNAKIEEPGNYLFVVLKPAQLDSSGDIQFSDLDLFLGRDFLITVQEGECEPVRNAIDRLRAEAGAQRADQLFYRVADAVTDSVLPALDQLDELAD